MQILILGATGILGQPVTRCLINQGHRVRVLTRSGVAHTVFCPTWVMEVLHNFIHGDRAAMIIGRKPPALHFFAAADFGRMVATAYDDGRTLGKRLFVHGPEGVTLPDALERFVTNCHPELKLMRLKLWQARLIAKL